MINTRRRFLRDASLTATGLCLSSRLGAKKKAIRTDSIKCSPLQSYALAGTISSAQSGNWSDPSTWDGKIPDTTDIPLISPGHTVIYDVAQGTYSGLSISSGGTLQFNPNASTVFQSTGNVVVLGTLTMRPASAAVVQTMRFININESSFVGGGMNVLDTDIGLWCMGSGVLDLVGAPKTSFVRAVGSIAAGASSITLNATPAGWQVGDDITIAPTEAPIVGDAYINGFDERTIKALSGTSLTLSSGTLRVHPQINNLWTAEIINLTRNVRIEGTATGRTHIFIRSAVPQSIHNIQVRYTGPRKDRGGSATAEFVLGRYGIHFHHCDNGSYGSVVEGCVVRDTGSHAYVPHASNGVTMKGNVAYNITEIAFWWDVLDLTHGIIWDSNIVALVKYVTDSMDIDSGDAPTFASSGFLIGVGDDNVCTNNVTIGTMGDFRAGGAYYWMEGKIESVWIFRNNMAHNCHCGLISWQNNLKNHVIENSVLYNNDMGIYHGAYTNTYQYRGGYVYNSQIQIKASSGDTNRVKFENLVIDAAGLDYGINMLEGPLDGEVPIFVRNCTITGHKIAGVINQSPNAVKKLDVIQCTAGGISGGAIALLSSAVDYLLSPVSGANETIRVQPPGGQAYILTHTGKTNIPNFAPTIWGDGNGLKGEYYNDANLGNLVFTRTDVNVSFQDWGLLGVHYKIPGNVYSMRWTGKVMAQFSEAYMFQVRAGGGFRLWIDGKLIIDNWQENYPSAFNAAPVTLVGGQKYDIKLEYFNQDDRTEVGLLWTSPSLPLEYIPMDQLFSDATSQPPTNIPPVANAGSDVTITLPTSSVTLDGTASKDTDGTIVSYSWVKVAGPSQFTITNATQVTATVTNLVAGVYVFRLQVIDDKGAAATDDVTITVKAANLQPVANAGNDINITLPTNSTTLNGSSSNDPDGSIAKYSWAYVSGPSQYAIGNASAATTPLSNLVAGTYVFRLTVTDDKGATASDDVTVVVNNTGTPGNQPPVANAGNDITITLPANSATLNGSASKDPDGSIVKYSWAKISGPSQYVFASATSAINIVTGLVAGSYVFRLTVTDDKGATANDDVTVLVKESTSPGNQAPIANAGDDMTVQLPTTSVITLNGAASYDPDGSIVSYKWVKTSGPSQFSLSTPLAATTQLTNVVAGTYVFRLTVTDDKGATASDTVTVIVLDIKTPDPGFLKVIVKPNPSNSVFRLQITSTDTAPVTIRVFDTNGRLVTRMNNVGYNTTVTMGAYWHAGLYTAVVTQGASKVIVRLLKV